MKNRQLWAAFLSEERRFDLLNEILFWYISNKCCACCAVLLDEYDDLQKINEYLRKKTDTILMNQLNNSSWWLFVVLASIIRLIYIKSDESFLYNERKQSVFFFMLASFLVSWLHFSRILKMQVIVDVAAIEQSLENVFSLRSNIAQ